MNSRLDEIQSTILNFKITHVDKFIKTRRKIASIYFKELQNTSLVLPKINSECFHVFNTFTVFHKRRQKIINFLDKNKIKTRIIYPFPIHKMIAYKNVDKKKSLKISDELSRGIFSLPLYPEMKINDVKRICKLLKMIA